MSTKKAAAPSEVTAKNEAAVGELNDAMDAMEAQLGPREGFPRTPDDIGTFLADLGERDHLRARDLPSADGLGDVLEAALNEDDPLALARRSVTIQRDAQIKRVHELSQAISASEEHLASVRNEWSRAFTELDRLRAAASAVGVEDSAA